MAEIDRTSPAYEAIVGQVAHDLFPSMKIMDILRDDSLHPHIQDEADRRYMAGDRPGLDRATTGPRVGLDTAAPAPQMARAGRISGDDILKIFSDAPASNGAQKPAAPSKRYTADDILSIMSAPTEKPDEAKDERPGPFPASSPAVKQQELDRTLQDIRSQGVPPTTTTEEAPAEPQTDIMSGMPMGPAVPAVTPARAGEITSGPVKGAPPLELPTPSAAPMPPEQNQVLAQPPGRNPILTPSEPPAGKIGTATDLVRPSLAPPPGTPGLPPAAAEAMEATRSLAPPPAVATPTPPVAPPPPPPQAPPVMGPITPENPLPEAATVPYRGGAEQHDVPSMQTSSAPSPNLTDFITAPISARPAIEEATQQLGVLKDRLTEEVATLTQESDALAVSGAHLMERRSEAKTDAEVAAFNTEVTAHNDRLVAFNQRRGAYSAAADSFNARAARLNVLGKSEDSGGIIEKGVMATGTFLRQGADRADKALRSLADIPLYAGPGATSPPADVPKIIGQAALNLTNGLLTIGVAPALGVGATGRAALEKVNPEIARMVLVNDPATARGIRLGLMPTEIPVDRTPEEHAALGQPITVGEAVEVLGALGVLMGMGRMATSDAQVYVNWGRPGPRFGAVETLKALPPYVEPAKAVTPGEAPAGTGGPTAPVDVPVTVGDIAAATPADPATFASSVADAAVSRLKPLPATWDATRSALTLTEDIPGHVAGSVISPRQAAEEGYNPLKLTKPARRPVATATRPEVPEINTEPPGAGSMETTPNATPSATATLPAPPPAAPAIPPIMVSAAHQAERDRYAPRAPEAPPGPEETVAPVTSPASEADDLEMRRRALADRFPAETPTAPTPATPYTREQVQTALKDAQETGGDWLDAAKALSGNETPEGIAATARLAAKVAPEFWADQGRRPWVASQVKAELLRRRMDTKGFDIHDDAMLANAVRQFGGIAPTDDLTGELAAVPAQYKSKNGLPPSAMAEAINDQYGHGAEIINDSELLRRLQKAPVAAQLTALSQQATAADAKARQQEGDEDQRILAAIREGDPERAIWLVSTAFHMDAGQARQFLEEAATRRAAEEFDPTKFEGLATVESALIEHFRTHPDEEPMVQMFDFLKGREYAPGKREADFHRFGTSQEVADRLFGGSRPALQSFVVDAKKTATTLAKEPNVYDKQSEGLSQANEGQRYESTPEGEQAVVPGTPKRAIPTTTTRAVRPQRAFEDTPLGQAMGAHRAAQQQGLFETPQAAPRVPAVIPTPEPVIEPVRRAGRIVHPDIEAARLRAYRSKQQREGASPERIANTTAWIEEADADAARLAEQRAADAQIKAAGAQERVAKVQEKTAKVQERAAKALERAAGAIEEAVTPEPTPEAPKPAPVVWRGWQGGAKGRPPLQLWDLTHDIPDHPKGSTLSRQTLERAGYEVPEPPEPAPTEHPAEDRVAQAQEKAAQALERAATALEAVAKRAVDQGEVPGRRHPDQGGVAEVPEPTYPLREGADESSYDLFRQASRDLLRRVGPADAGQDVPPDTAGVAEPAGPEGERPPVRRTGALRDVVPDLGAAGGIGRHAGAGVRTLARSLAHDLANLGRVDLRGTVVNSASDLAAVAQIFRDPRYETFRIVYMRGDQIAGHEATTTRSPGSARAFVDPREAKGYDAMRRRMDRLGADGYWLLHNHPSTSPHPSPEDLAMTARFAEHIPGFRGHVVIDHEEYGLIDVSDDGARDAGVFPAPTPADARYEAAIPSAILNERISGESAVARLGLLFNAPQGWISLFYADSQNRLRQVQEMPRALFLRPREATSFIKGQQRGVGGARVFAYTRDHDRDVSRAADQLGREGVLKDYVWGAGESRGFYRDSGDAGARVRVEEMSDRDAMEAVKDASSHLHYLDAVGGTVPRPDVEPANTPEGATLLAPEPVSPGAVQRAAATVPPRAPGTQMLRTLERHGVPADELADLGLTDWLQGQSGIVTREALQRRITEATKRPVFVPPPLTDQGEAQLDGLRAASRALTAQVGTEAAAVTQRLVESGVSPDKANADVRAVLAPGLDEGQFAATGRIMQALGEPEGTRALIALGDVAQRARDVQARVGDIETGWPDDPEATHALIDGDHRGVLYGTADEMDAEAAPGLTVVKRPARAGLAQMRLPLEPTPEQIASAMEGLPHAIGPRDARNETLGQSVLEDAARAALGARSVRDAGRGVGGGAVSLRPQPEPARWPGLAPSLEARLAQVGFARTFATGEPVEFYDLPVRTLDDLAIPGQVLRRPDVEVSRIFFGHLDDKGVPRVLRWRFLTMKLPNAASPWTRSPTTNNDKWHREVAAIRRYMQIIGADRYWLMHNHPGGDPNASIPDVKATRGFARAVPGFQGHVIIDHESYGTVDAEGKRAVHPLDVEDTLLVPAIPGPALGRPVRVAADVVPVAQASQLDKQNGVVLFHLTNARVRAVEIMPVDEYAIPSLAAHQIQEHMRQLGSTQVVALAPFSAGPRVMQAAMRLVGAGVLADHIVAPEGTFKPLSVERMLTQAGSRPPATAPMFRTTDQAAPLSESESDRYRAEIAPPFFSALRRVAEQKLPERASAEQILNTLKKTPGRGGIGVKADEFKWTYLDEWLSEQKGPVAKADVLAYLDDYGVKVRESLRGTPNAQAESGQRAFRQAFAPALPEEYARHFRDVFAPLGYYPEASWSGPGYLVIRGAPITNSAVDLAELNRKMDRLETQRIPAHREAERLRYLDTPSEAEDMELGRLDQTLAIIDGQEQELDRQIQSAVNRDRARFFAIRAEDRAILSRTDDFDEAVVDAWRDQEARAGRSVVDADEDVRGHGAAEYEGYKAVKGGQRYRELLFLYERPKWPEPTDIRVEAFKNHNGGRDYHTFVNGKPWVDIGGYESEPLAIKRVEKLWREKHGEPHYTPPHFTRNPAPDMIAHVRFDERVDDQGRKGALIQEVQDDLDNKIRALQTQLTKYEQQHAAAEDDSPVQDHIAQTKAEITRLEALLPFRGGKSNEMILKRMLRYAAEQGYDFLALATGEQQANLYNLNQYVRRIIWTGKPEARGDILVEKRDAPRGEINRVTPEGIRPDEIADYIGAEPAARLLAATPRQNGDRILEGADLEVSGKQAQGKKKTYDEILPAVLNKLAKPWGQKVEDGKVFGDTGTTSMTETVHMLPITGEMQDALLRQGFPLFQPEGDRYGTGPEPDWMLIDEDIDRMGEAVLRQHRSYPAWAEAMREWVPPAMRSRLPAAYARLTGSVPGPEAATVVPPDEVIAQPRPAYEEVPPAGQQSIPGTEAPAPETARAGQMPKYAGNINLERLDTVDAVKQAILDQADRNRVTFERQRRGVIPDMTMESLADLAGVHPDQLLSLGPGTAWNAENILAARQLLVASAEKLTELQRASSAPDATHEDMARFVEALMRHVGIQQAIAGLAAEAGRALRQFRIKARATEDWDNLIDRFGGPEHVREAADYIGRTDPNDLGTFDAVTRGVSRGKSDTSIPGKLYFYWINALLSGPHTHIIKVASDLTFETLKATVERPLAGTIDHIRAALTRTPQERFAREGLAEIYAAPQGFREGVAAFLESWRYQTEVLGRGPEDYFARGNPFLEPKHQLTQDPNWAERALGRYERTRTRRVIGTTIGIPTRLIVAETELAKAIAYRTSLHAEAFRMAMGEGLHGKAVWDRAAEIAQDTNTSAEPIRWRDLSPQERNRERMVLDKLVESAIREAHVRTYTDEVHPWVQALSDFVGTKINVPAPALFGAGAGALAGAWAGGATGAAFGGMAGASIAAYAGLIQIAPLAWILPFRRLPSRIFAQTFRYSGVPYGIYMLAREMTYRRALKQYGRLYVANHETSLLEPEGPAGPPPVPPRKGSKGGQPPEEPPRGGPLSEEYARVVIGTALMGFAILMVQIGLMIDQSLLTGSGPTESGEKRIWEARGRKRYHIRVPFTNWQFGYQRLGWPGTLLGMFADMLEYGQSRARGNADIVAKGMSAITDNLMNATFLTSLRDATKAIADSGRFMQGFVKSFVSSFVPTLLAQATGIVDPSARMAPGTLESTQRRIPGVSQGLLPVRDIWGQPVSHPLGERFARVFSPVEGSIQREDPIAAELDRIGVLIGRPGASVQNMDLTRQERDRYEELAGGMAKDYLGRTFAAPGYQEWAPQAQADAAREAIREARTDARDLLLSEIGMTGAEMDRRQQERRENRTRPAVRDLLRQGR